MSSVAVRSETTWMPAPLWITDHDDVAEQAIAKQSENGRDYAAEFRRELAWRELIALEDTFRAPTAFDLMSDDHPSFPGGVH